ncbi:hypothetical protein COEREDRAFT_79214 [Coemansia reversa NRRL 1564]|uniref:BAH domain-containing protein n=1 Tax=Coemansia reversa (strain ATCC 12441 / NRRL 1564) TaxID=763665 RepID=A0A2G5BJT0_COERN|nr:hypothetical protein COEREDRAFT_79214 [Coemansia reversa NRRL 1564]|eukprot:PIA19259.1 hypothetical protein COEREDRAFT_79214 [Coemansia reversa NRRL 1564]
MSVTSAVSNNSSSISTEQSLVMATGTSQVSEFEDSSSVDTELSLKRRREDEAEYQSIDSVEYGGREYYIGDHVTLEDVENISGTRDTQLPAVAQIHGIQRNKGADTTTATVIWYVYPQLTPHPPYMEFYENTLLRTSRQTTVSVDRIRGICYVVQPSEAREGHPKEWKEGEYIYVCDSRFVDSGMYIQRIKGQKGFWPQTMSEHRRAMLTNMVRWPSGPRELGKSVVPMLKVGEDDDDAHTPQTRRTSRMSAAAGSAQQQASSLASPLPASFPAVDHAQLLAYQQMLSQKHFQQQQQPPPFVLPITAPGQTDHPQISSQQQQLQQHAVNHTTYASGPLSMPGMSTPGSPKPPVPLGSTPKRRGRPPKNIQLIKKRAMEDAAVAAAAASAAQQRQQYSQMSPLQAPIRPNFLSPYTNNVRPPQLPQVSGATSTHPSVSVASTQHVAAVNRSAFGYPQQTQAMRSQPAAIASSQAPAAPSPQQHLQQQPQQPQQPQQLHQPQLQANASKDMWISYADSSAGPKLPNSIVELFPTVNGSIRWFATPPISLRPAPKPHHSKEYLSWSKQK